MQRQRRPSAAAAAEEEAALGFLANLTAHAAGSDQEADTRRDQTKTEPEDDADSTAAADQLLLSSEAMRRRPCSESPSAKNVSATRRNKRGRPRAEADR